MGEGIKIIKKICDSDGFVSYYIVEYQHDQIKLTAYEFLKLSLEGHRESEDY